MPFLFFGIIFYFLSKKEANRYKQTSFSTSFFEKDARAKDRDIIVSSENFRKIKGNEMRFVEYAV